MVGMEIYTSAEDEEICLTTAHRTFWHPVLRCSIYNYHRPSSTSGRRTWTRDPASRLHFIILHV